MSILLLKPQNPTANDYCNKFCTIQGPIQNSFNNKSDVKEYSFPTLDPREIAEKVAVNSEFAIHFWQGHQGIFRAPSVNGKPSLKFISYVIDKYRENGIIIDEYFIAGILWSFDNNFKNLFNSEWETLSKSCGLTIL